MKGKKRNNAVGLKGRSGRKNKWDETIKQQVIENAWLKKQKALNDKEAIQIVLKDMTEKTSVSGKVVVEMNFDDTFNLARKTKGDNKTPGQVQNNSGGQA